MNDHRKIMRNQGARSLLHYPPPVRHYDPFWRTVAFRSNGVIYHEEQSLPADSPGEAGYVGWDECFYTKQEMEKAVRKWLAKYGNPQAGQKCLL